MLLRKVLLDFMFFYNAINRLQNQIKISILANKFGLLYGQNGKFRDDGNYALDEAFTIQ
jgi:hypothetical protein